jgi:MFS transporter, FSR family, fosmidomycin resistance protein
MRLGITPMQFGLAVQIKSFCYEACVTTFSPTRANTAVYAILFAAAGCHLINDTLQAVMLSVYPMLKQNYALSFSQVGLLTMVYQVTASILQPLIGHFTDKKPLPYILPFGPAFTALGLILLATAHSYPALLIAAACIGIGSSIFHPDASRVSRLASGGQYGMAQSLFQVGGNIGTSIGPLLAAGIVLQRGQTSLAWFAGLAAVSIIILSAVGRWYSTHLTQKKSGETILQSGLDQRTVKISLAILVALMFSKFVYMACMHSFYTFYLIDKFGVSTQAAQLYLFVLLGAVAVGTFAGGPIGDRIGRKSVIWFSILGTLPFSLALPHLNLFWTVACTIPIGLILSSAFSAMVVYAQELMPGRVGMISGLFFGLAFGSGGLGAAVLGVIADHTTLQFIFELCSVLPAIGLLAFYLPSTEQLKSKT